MSNRHGTTRLRPHAAASLCCLLLPACLLAANCVAAEDRPDRQVLDLSPGPQLFLDDHWIAAKENIRRRIEQPQKHPRNPLIVREHPWEKRFIQLYGTVLYDAPA
ncbi:MAG: hypothetical protein WDZ48_03095, partial [Pirellulales bacterium]